MTKDEMIELKDQIIKDARAYLKENYFIDLTDFVQIEKNVGKDDGNRNFVRAIAHQMRFTGKYEVFELDDKYYLSPIPKKTWRERNWLWLAILAYFIGLLSPTISKSIEQRILPESSQSSTTTQEKPVGK